MPQYYKKKENFKRSTKILTLVTLCSKRPLRLRRSKQLPDICLSEPFGSGSRDTNRDTNFEGVLMEGRDTNQAGGRDTNQGHKPGINQGHKPGCKDTNLDGRLVSGRDTSQPGGRDTDQGHKPGINQGHKWGSRDTYLDGRVVSGRDTNQV